MYQKIRLFFYPEFMLPKNLIQKWYIDNKNAYISSTNIYLIGLAIIIFAQLILMDIPSGFQPRGLFVYIRSTLIVLCLIAIFFGKKIKNIYWYKVPYLIVFSFFAVGQFILMHYEPIIPFFIGIMALCISLVGMGLSLGFTFFVTTILFSALAPIMHPPIETVPMKERLIGYYIVVVIFVCFFRSRIFKDVRIFWLTESERQAREELENAQMKLVQSSRFAELGRVSANVAHEINSPLMGVRNSLGIIQDVIKENKFDAEEIDDLKASADNVELGIKFITDVVNNISNAAGNPEAPCQTESMSEVVNMARGLTRYNSNGKAKILIDVSPDLKAWMQKVKAIQCIINLITNAVYAMEQAKTNDAQIKIRAEAKDNQVHLIIQDNGPGISKHIQENIFKPFYTNKPVGTGTGQGLSIVKNMMQEMGGQVDYRTSDQGTEFILAFACGDISTK